MERIGIILYAKYPLAVSREVVLENGIKDGTLRGYLSQHPEYFQSKNGGDLSLTTHGFKWVQDEVIPPIIIKSE